MSEPLFLKGVLQEKIWGGDKLKKEFGYPSPSNKTGELWAISAHKNGPATVSNGIYEGHTLDELWKEHRELFGNQEGEVFPLLTKIIDATDDLSVQVHPDDAYGLEHEGELGKTECWYIIDAEEEAEIIFGHHAQTKEEFTRMIDEGQWTDLLRYVKVKAGDFFYVPSGTIHAIGSGIMILETQQSSDTTYRVYDYDRTDDEGNTRPLHIQQSIDVTTIPHTDPVPAQTIRNVGDSTLTTLVTNAFFTVQKWMIKERTPFTAEGAYTLVSVLEGSGQLMIDGSSYNLNKGMHFIIPSGISRWEIEGDLMIIASVPGKEADQLD
ncbi:MAG: mannose-6-phosphate isomerase, class I [Alkalibacterium sp.]|nr:mannose-6-phosphate isomerase, class I [Alkalibacterium sp.]